MGRAGTSRLTTGVPMTDYVTTVDGVTPQMLSGFFVGWPNPPSPETHLDVLRRSHFVVLAIDREANRVAGFVNAVSDGILAAYLPLLEVLPGYRGQGIGTELVRRMLDQCAGLYAVDVTCDPDLQPFYARCGMRPSVGAMRRDYAAQSGEAVPMR